MPLVSVVIGDPAQGKSFTVLLECCQGVDYSKISLVMNGLSSACTSQSKPDIEKDCVKLLLGLAQSDRERECIRYSIFKASGMSATQARHHFGFDNMIERSAGVEKAITEAQKIRETVEDIACVQDKALLATFGIQESSDSSSSDTEDTEIVSANQKSKPSADIVDLCKKNLALSRYNWFQLKEVFDQEFGDEAETLLDGILCDLSALKLTAEEESLVYQSRQAFLAAQNDARESERTAEVLNGLIVSDMESDNPDEYIELQNPLSDAGRLLILKRRRAIKRRASRMRAKAIANQKFLARKSPKRVSKVLTECPNIGLEIEKFVSDHNVGADAWRRTGILTFDGNSHLPQKVTYERIRQHLQSVYKRHFGYGTIVQLCVARNKRHLSSQRYQGVANVTTRRARKGFSLRYNPDSHWSASMYKGLNDIQLRDSRDLCIINRDDAAGFRLDTLTTCKQYGTPTVRGQDILTTRTDYVNKYPSTLQVTSYNISATETVEEICIGVVKAPSSIHPKNPTQHAEDLKMLEKKEELAPVFYNPETNISKAVDAIRVDGAGDEGPSHIEVQYYWTERHLLKNKVATIVTTRSSGSSYLNRVELQNGCLSKGHSNTFIPSTLGGSCVDPNTGDVDSTKLKENMRMAVDAYISCVNGCSCGNTFIRLYPGPDSSQQQIVRQKLLKFLKGSNKIKETLKCDEPALYAHFELIRTVRDNHIITGLSSYHFFLLCCYKSDCPHPRCQAGRPQSISTWYPGGPALNVLPLPVPDTDRPWGCTSCSTCKGFCAGHYKLKLVDITNKKELSAVPSPPSVELKKLFDKSDGTISEDAIQDVARKVLLPPEECRIWLNHLQIVSENRRRGAKKAAETRRGKRVNRVSSATIDDQSSTKSDGDSEEWFCGVCEGKYIEQTDEPEIWICCEKCDGWYHASCEGLSSIPPEEVSYCCQKCQVYR